MQRQKLPKTDTFPYKPPLLHHKHNEICLKMQRLSTADALYPTVIVMQGSLYSTNKDAKIELGEALRQHT